MKVDDNHHGQGLLGGSGQEPLTRPLAELSDEELAKAKREVHAGLARQKASGAEAEAASEKFRRIIEEIEGLAENQFELRSREIARQHGVSVSVLRRWWKQLHQVERESRPGGGKRVELTMEDAWPEKVNTTELLATVLAKVREYVVLSSSGALAVALYTMLTYVVDELSICPMLLLQSAVKRSGKTTLLGLLLRLSYRALGASSISPAALYRVVDCLKPTLLLDEVDATLAQKTDTSEALRGLLNAGNDRTSSRVLRCVGEEKEVVSYDAFGAKVLAGIGHIPDTMEDRSVVVELRRKLESEKVRRFSVLDDQTEFKEIRRKHLRWANDYGKTVGRARPALPYGLNDRAADNWSPLLAIADLAGGEWGKRARTAAIELCSRVRDDEQDIRFELLKDIKSIFEGEGGEACKAITTSTLIEKLCGLEEAPWAAFFRGERISPRGLARMLRPLGIMSANLKLGREPDTRKDVVAKGYKQESFIDPWARYLPLPATRQEKGVDFQGNQGKTGVAEKVAVAPENPLPHEAGGGVADKSRYRYPNATERESKKGPFSGEIRGVGAGGSAVAEKKDPLDQDRQGGERGPPDG
ncbi:MAG: DUF3631 domain-containing protein [Spirochaetia bacterium]|jgi:putative DNA primase/helicase